MRTHARGRGAGLAVLALGLWLLTAGHPGNAADDKEPGLPVSETDFNKLVEKSAKDLTTALSAKKPTETDVNKARAAAVMLAAYAQYATGGASAEQRATLQESALKIAAALKGKKFDVALKEAQGLTSLKPDGKAKLVGGSLLKKADVPLRLVMRQMDPAPKGYGSYALYKKLTGAGTVKKELPDKLMTDDLALAAFQTAFIAELAKGHTPEKNAKNVKMLVATADELSKASLLVAEATKKKDGAVALAEVYRVTLTCNKCHSKFRED